MKKIISASLIALSMSSFAFADGVSLQFDTSQLPAAMVGNAVVQYEGQYSVGNTTMYANFNWTLKNQVVQVNIINVPVQTDLLDVSLTKALNFVVFTQPGYAPMMNAEPPQNPTCPETLRNQPLSPGLTTIAFSAEAMRPLPGKSLYLPGYWIDCKIIN